MEYALAVQELFPALQIKYDSAEELISHCEHNSGSPVSRLYLGGSFCGRLFIKIAGRQFEFFAPYCLAHNLKISLTVPVFTEQHLAEGKRVIVELLKTYGGLIDEVSINDCAMYDFVSQSFSGRLFAGRLISKVVRDPRYPEYGRQSVRIPAPPVSVSGAELDASASELILEGASDDYIAAVYTPYSYISTGMICSYASFYLDVEKKFTPLDNCAAICGKYYTKHEDNAGNVFYHIGNTIYYASGYPRVTGASTVRQIWFPLDLWEVKT